MCPSGAGLFVVFTDEPTGPTARCRLGPEHHDPEEYSTMTPDAFYRIYRLEHGMTEAERRAHDMRMGEMAAAASGLAHSFNRILSTPLGLLRRAGRACQSSARRATTA
jgi:hypothetical protein